MAVFVGDNSSNTLVGGSGADELQGLGGNDSLNGGSGNDSLAGGTGNDTLTGSGGQDSFVFAEFGAGNADTLSDFAGNWDSIRLDAAAFTALGALGRFVSGDVRFFAGTAAHDADDRIIYNVATGQLWYDADGNGSGAAQLIATLTTRPAVIATDFWVFNGGGTPPPPPPTGQTINGTSGNDSLTGGGGNDTLSGNAGSDSLDGGAGNDSLTGGSGADRFVFTSIGSANADVVDDFISGTDSLHLDARVMTALGISGAFASGDARFFAGSAAHDADDRVVYNATTGDLFYDADGSGAGAAQLVANLRGMPAISASDIVVDNGTTPPGAINGTAGNDSLTGTANADTINGLGGDDTLNGLEGNDALNGGLGDDLYLVSGDDVLSDDGGIDTVVVEGSWTLGAGFENLRIEGPGADASTGIGNELANVLDGRAEYVTLIGAGGDDFLSGTNRVDSLDGGSGNDTIEGDGNYDTIIGGAGNDVLNGNGLLLGGDGNDRLTVEFADARLDGGAGADTLSGGEFRDVFVFSAAPGAANADAIGGFTSGTDEVELDGNAFANIGASGDLTSDRFRAAAGATSAADSSDRVIYNTTSGDLWYDSDGAGGAASVRFATLSGAPTLAAGDISVVNGGATGGTGVVINGTSVSDSLVGTAGNDTINGLGADDTIDGAAGNDTLNGGDGADRFVFDAAGDYGSDRIDGGAGIWADIVSFEGHGASGAVIDFQAGTMTGGGTGGSGSAVLIGLEGALGTAFGDRITGSATANSLEGRGGNDTIIGGSTGGFLSGDDGDDSLVGGAAGDILVAGQGRDTLLGGGGDDQFWGNLHGNDFVDGGTGSDTILIGESTVVTVDLGAGTMVGGDVAGQSHTTLLNIENVTVGAWSANMTGSSAANSLTGNFQSDTLDGAGGNDFLTGNGGADAFLFRSPAGTANADTVTDFASGTDKILLDPATYTTIGAGGNFAAGDARFFAAAGASGGHDADDRVVYNASTGQLWYDADGNGAAAAQLVATLQGAPALVATDIVAAADLPATRPVWEHHTVLDNGASANRVDLVWVGDGFTADQIDEYDAHVDAMLADMLSGSLATQPFGRYANFFNVHVVDVVSNQSGADRPGDPRDTALGAFFQDGAIFIDQGKASNAVADSFRGTDLQAEMRFAVVNDNAGGTGGTFSVYGYNGGSTSANIALHEAGHSFADLGDQYWTPGTTWVGTTDPSFADLTIDPSGEKWSQWLGYDQPGIGVIGAYEGGGHTESGIWRPSLNSKMRDTSQPFDAVGRESFVLKFYELVDPLDSWLANTSTLHDQDDFWVDSIDPAVISVDWTINGQTFVNAGERISLSDLGFGAGDYDVSARAYDPTDWVRVADRSSLEESVQWHTVNGGTPGGGQVINGTSGDDSLVGGAENDTLNGFAGNDTLDGGAGADSLVGGDGNDLYRVDSSADVIVEAENAGTDTVQSTVDYGLGAFVNNLTLTGSARLGGGNDIDNVIDATALTVATQLDGWDGNDTLLGGTGSNELNGWGGNDSMVGGAGNDFFDTQDRGGGIDTMDGQGGDDSFFVTPGDVVIGGAGNDTVFSMASWTLGATEENLVLHTGTDDHDLVGVTAIGNVLNNVIDAGFDVVDSTLDGKAGNDTLVGGGANVDFLFSVSPGTANADVIVNFDATSNKVVLDGAVHANSGPSGVFAVSDARFWAGTAAHDADDRVIYNSASGQLWYDTDGNGAGAQQLIATLQGAPALGAGNIEITNGGTSTGGTVVGTSGNDSLVGSSGNDSINGGSGNDSLAGGGGNDTLTGSGGQDSFVFRESGAANADAVTDFASNWDRFMLDDAAFTGIGVAGRFAAGDARFYAAAGATGGHDATDRVVYDTSTGSLYYDADGNGGGGAQLVATLTTHPTLAAADINVI